MYTSRIPDIYKRNMGDPIISGTQYKKEETLEVTKTPIESRKNSAIHIEEKKEDPQEKENDGEELEPFAETKRDDALLIDELTKRVNKLEDIISKFVTVLDIPVALPKEELICINKSVSTATVIEEKSEMSRQDNSEANLDTVKDMEKTEDTPEIKSKENMEEEFMEEIKMISERLVGKLRDEVYKYIFPTEHKLGIPFTDIKVVQHSELEILQTNIKREMKNNYNRLKENQQDAYEDLKELIKSSIAPFVEKDEYRSNAEKVESQLEAISTNLEDLSQKTSEELAILNEKLEQIQAILDKKAEGSDLDKLWTTMEKAVDYSDLKELYSKVMPPIKRFEDLAGKIEKEREEVREGMKKIEGFLAEYKVSFFQDGQKVENVAKFVTSNEMNALIKEVEKNFNEHKIMIEGLRSAASKDWDCMKSNRIFNVESLKHECEVKREDIGQLKYLVDSKMDKVEAPALEAIKVDQFQAMRFYEFVKKQQQCILLLVSDFMKTALKNRKETEESRINKRVHLIAQANSLAKWLANADQPSASTKIEDTNNVLFSPRGVSVPKELKQFNRRVDEVYKTLNTSRQFSSQQNTHFDSSILVLDSPNDSPRKTISKEHRGLLNRTTEFDKTLFRDSPTHNKQSRYVSLNMSSNSGVTLIRDTKHTDNPSPSKIDKLNLPRLYY